MTLRIPGLLLSILATLSLGAALSAASALAAAPVAHPTAVPAKVTPYRASLPPSAGSLHARLTGSNGPQPCTGPGTISAAQTYYGFGYLSNQIAQAYQLTPFYQAGDEGQGQTIALLELEPNSANDIAAYQGCYQTNTTVNYIPIDGGVNGSGVDTTDPGSGEAALDIEQIIGLAPRATIDVYQAPNTTTGIVDAYQAMVNNPAVTIISTSWGACEAGNPLPTLEAPIFSTAAANSISTFAAAGDSGSTDCGTSALAVDDPASQPNVTGVGGTSLPNLTAVDQQFAWNSSSMSQGATGGGFSALWSEPTWQQAAAAASQTSAAAAGELSCPVAASGGYCRGVPDVSADADPYTGYIIYLTQNVTDPSTGTTSPQLTATPWGGTSAAAPLWAAMTALVNASAACNGHNLGPLNPLLYPVAVKGMAGLTNITSGNNDYTVDNPTAYFTAHQGFSPVTGLGTPLGAPLARSLCAEADTLTLKTPSSEASGYGQPVDLASISATDAQGHALSYSASGLPPGLSINPQTGVITGTPTANAEAEARVTVTAADNGATQTHIISWTVTGAPAVVAPAAPPLPPTSAPTATGGQQPGGTGQHGGQGHRHHSPAHVIRMIRRFRGGRISVTLTITTRRGHRHLLIRYAIHAPHSHSRRLKSVELLLRPSKRRSRHGQHADRFVILRRNHASRGRLSLTLTSKLARRGFALELRYSSAHPYTLTLPS